MPLEQQLEFYDPKWRAVTYSDGHKQLTCSVHSLVSRRSNNLGEVYCSRLPVTRRPSDNAMFNSSGSLSTCTTYNQAAQSQLCVAKQMLHAVAARSLLQLA